MMRTVILAGLLSFSMICHAIRPAAAAEGDAPATAKGDLAAVHAFVQKHLVGKTIEDRTTAIIGNGGIETEFQRRTMYLNLQRTVGDYPAITFDAIILIKQTNYDLGPDGKRLPKPPVVKNRSLVYRFSFEERKSTGKLVGSSVSLTSSTSGFAGSSEAIELSLSGDKLVMVKHTPLYFDGFAPGGKEVPGAATTTQEFWSEDGKLVSLAHEVGYEVDPKTLQKKANGHDVKLNGKEIPSLY